ncbi:HAMP domain-containing protein [candidate division KSB1 bacterium]|nr:HAMP domain-containing protein [candidate division KSB1 bacterium]
MSPLGRIGRRLLLWFLAVALIPLLFMGFQSYRFARAAVEREVFLHMQAVAVSKQRAIEQWFAERLADLRVIASTPEVVRLMQRRERSPRSHEQVAAVLRTYQRQSGAYVDLCLHDAHGAPVSCTAGDDLRMGKVAPEALIANALAEPLPVMSPIYLNPNYGPSLHLAGAVRDSSGATLGAVVVTLALAQTLDPIILDTTGLGRTGQAYLVDAERVMLTPSRFMNHPAPLTHKMNSEGIQRAIAGGSGASVYPGFDGQQVMGAWGWLPQQQWALIAEMDAAEAFEPLDRLKRDTLLVALITGLVIVLVVWQISRTISQPIRRLAEASAAIAQGELERKVAVDLNDEVGELATRFNQMVASLRDSQRQLVQSERLAAIGEITASIVHEIRNPLSSIKMNLQILEAKAATDQISQEQFAIARQQAERVERLLNELLDYSKPLTLERVPVRLADVINDVARSTLPQLDATGARLKVQVPDSLLTISADRDKLEQALMNLVLNAIQAAKRNGLIAVFARKTESDGRFYAAISVNDDGAGIPAERLSRVFEPFFTTRKQGTGLGLSNAKKIAEAHGGRIEIISAPGEGTEVKLLLPLWT